jgi:hypothetical protein
MRRDVEMTKMLLEAGADTQGGIWPNRDATSPRTIAEERGYNEIVAMRRWRAETVLGSESKGFVQHFRPTFSPDRLRIPAISCVF